MAAKKSAKKTPKATSKQAPRKAADKKPVKGKASSLDVNMGHVFALRPRVTTSFKAGDFSTAKHQLQDDSYSSIQEAAQAVVEKALELTHGEQNKGRGRRF